MLGTTGTAATLLAAGTETARAGSDGYGEAGYGDGPYGDADGLSVTTETPTNVTDTSATLNGSLTDLGGAASADCYFEWRRVGASSWQTTATQTLTSTGSFSADLTGLEDGTDYEYRAVAEASDGDTATGVTTDFTTSEDLPAVATNAPSNVSATSATLHGSLDDLGGASSADCYFEWRSVGASSWNTTAKQTLSSTGSFSTDLTGLSADTDYEYRALAAASDGDADTGTTVSFTTESPPTIDSYTVTEAGSPNPHCEITADWSVSDDNGNLASVTVAVYDSSGTRVDAETSDVSGSSASGTNKFTIKHANDQTFDVVLTVSDAAGNDTTETRTVTE